MNTPPAVGLKQRMLALHRSMGDRSTRSTYFDTEPWWREPAVLGEIGEALAHPFRDERVSLVISPASSGVALGALTAVALGAGFVLISKEAEPAFDSDTWLTATTAPDYRDRHLTMAVRRRLVRPADRVLAVDDVADTGGQLGALKKLVSTAGADWMGASVVIDTLERHATRRELGVRALIHGREID